MGGQKREIQPIESNRSPCSCRGPNKLTRRITSQSSIVLAHEAAWHPGMGVNNSRTLQSTAPRTPQGDR
uniref:Uncharacterized protein n=2 Tax=Oryza TaxID=4527 RepID=A0A0E0PCT7_ORYRU